MPDTGRDRLRELLDAPVAMRRRVLLERAAWQLGRGHSVTDAAIDAGYDSVDGFSRAFRRAFGHPPSRTAGDATTDHRLPAPNGIHFHPPTSLWVHTTEHAIEPLTEQLVLHDLDDTRFLLELAATLPDAEFRAPHLPGTTLVSWHDER